MSGTPGKLTYKQDIAIEHTVQAIQAGKTLQEAAKEATKIAYSPKNDATAKAMTYENFSKPTYRDELIQRLKEKNIIGAGGKVEQVIAEGLDATKRVGSHIDPDFGVRLSYVQEINRITGAYAPTKHESKNLNLNADLTED